MNNHILNLLDFKTIQNDVASYALSSDGANYILSNEPLSDESLVLNLKSLIMSLVEIFYTTDKLPYGTFAPIDDAIKTISKDGACLLVEELWALGMWSVAWKNFKAWLKNVKNDQLIEEINNSPNLDDVSSIVFKIITPEGEIKDTKKLLEIKNRIKHINRDIENSCTAFFKNEDTRAMLQNDLPTQRDGRTVLAVKINSKSKIKGIVHEVSATKQTIYIEPEILVQKNNELIEEESKYQSELLAVLKDATSKLNIHADEIKNAKIKCTYFDSLYAGARYSYITHGVFVEHNNNTIDLIGAKHPILGSKAVPIDICMPQKIRTIIITGPNTGGKTVALKTVGLLALMNQFGLALPVKDGSALPVFDEIWADIGDEQSINQSLSTFSAHMKNIASIIEGTTRKSLVLLDELGSGTDPEEGCAIAMALLDAFIEVGALTLVTTHHGLLKNYGYTKSSVLNASVYFDKNTMSPTYKIIMGIPGQSHALDIAEKNGILSKLVKAARAYLDDERSDITGLIRGLSDKHRELDELMADSQKKLNEIEEKQQHIESKTRELKQREIELHSDHLTDLKKLLFESRKTLENLVRELREGELTKEKTQNVKAFLSKLENDIKNSEIEIDAKAEYVSYSKDKMIIKAGASVLIKRGKLRGKIIRAAKNGKWLVETGTMRIAVAENEFEVTADHAINTKPIISLPPVSSMKNRAVLELDIRGLRLSEAVEIINLQLDAAIIEGLNGFSIIHGMGEGVLQEAVKKILSAHALVKDFYYALPENGGHGKTLVVMA